MVFVFEQIFLGSISYTIVYKDGKCFLVDFRLPYYMAYPTPLQYDDERIERRDFEYMKSMYPLTVKKILPYVEDECDRMSYEGSMIYDEYPDQLQIRLMCNRIYEKVKKIQPYTDQEMEIQTRRTDEGLKDLIQIMLFQELFQRRNRHRRKRRIFY